MLRHQFVWRNPSIALSQKADEIGIAPVNFGKTDRKGVSAFRLLRRNSPSQIHRDETDHAPGEPAFKLREDHFHKLVAFRLHVAECRGEKDTHKAWGVFPSILGVIHTGHPSI
jgi:hypothetical protein